MTAPYHHACSVCDAVKLPTSAGSTGTIRPIDTMSISTVIMMNGIAAWRLPASPAGASLGGRSSFGAVVRRFLRDLHVVDVALADAR